MFGGCIKLARNVAPLEALIRNTITGEHNVFNVN